MSQVFAIIVAGGNGCRFGKADKLLSDLAGQPVIWHTLNAFQENKQIDEITLVCAEHNFEEMQQIAKCFSKTKKVILGGKTRQESSFQGLKSLEAKDDDLVLIHNGANPLVSQMGINRIIEATKEFGSALVGQPEHSTLKKINEEGIIEETIERAGMWHAETPQGVKYKIGMQAFQKAEDEGYEGTDDAQIVEYFGYKVRMFKGSPMNIKITEPQDLELANLLIQKPQKSYVGIGQDSHPFAKEQKPLILGNYQVKQTGGLEGNSDGDVVIHALCNALSSAIGGYSLSRWSDRMCQKGITDSKFYLEKIYQEILNQGLHINNISLALEAFKPKLEECLPKIQKRLAQILQIQEKQIGITITSGEGLSDFGKGLGIQCFCFLSLGKT